MSWLQNNTFHHTQYANVENLCALKKKAQISLSVCIPTLNEEECIGHIVKTIKEALIDTHPLIDEIAVIDSGSTDQTKQAAIAAGADFYLSADILPNEGFQKGKGENLWKAIHQLKGDIICYIDGDISNIHPRFVCGLIGPLLENTDLSYVKACYDRPLQWKDNTEQYGGGRVTEVLVRPLFSLFFPELTQVMQPLSGEYAARRELLEKLPFPIGYGVETSHLLDIYLEHGINGIAQTDLDQRIHRHQSTVSLGKMAHEILRTFVARLERHNLLECNTDLFHDYLFPKSEDGTFSQITETVTMKERPPIHQLIEYQKRHAK